MNRINVHKTIIVEEITIPFEEPNGTNRRRGAQLRVPKDITPAEAKRVHEVLDSLVSIPPELVDAEMDYYRPPIAEVACDVPARRGLADAGAELDVLRRQCTDTTDHKQAWTNNAQNWEA